MSPLAEKTARRRFLLISAMRWFPSGLVLPILVLLMVARGIDLVTIGTLFAGCRGPQPSAPRNASG